MTIKRLVLTIASATIRSGAATGGIAVYEHYGPRNDLNYPRVFLVLLITTILIDWGKRFLPRRRARGTTP